MQHLVIDLSTGKDSFIEMTPQEEADHVARGQTRGLEEKARGKKEAKRVVVSKLAELREMRQNRAIFSQQDLDDKQTEIDDLVAVINAG